MCALTGLVSLNNVNVIKVRNDFVSLFLRKVKMRHCKPTLSNSNNLIMQSKLGP